MSNLSAVATELANQGLLLGSNITCSLLFATDPRGVIGSGDDLPWRCKDDLDRFRALTLGNVVVIGVKTYLGLLNNWPTNHVLKGRDVVVVYGTEQTFLPILGDGMLDAAAVKYQNWLGVSLRKKVGERLMFIPVPRYAFSNAKHPAAKRFREFFRTTVTADIEAFTQADQGIFICGGAMLNELMYASCHSAYMTIITHQLKKIPDPVKLGPLCAALMRKTIKGVNPPFASFKPLDGSTVSADYYHVPT